MGDALRLYGLKALVINAGSGIGEAVSRTLLKHGCAVLAVDTVNSGVEQQFASVKGIDGYSANLIDATRMPALIEEAVERLGGIDILITDFPLQPEAPLSDGDANLGSIGFLRSIFAADGNEAFAKSEQNLAALTRALGAETGEFGITANYVQPGAIMTPTSRDVYKKDMALRDFCIANSAASRLGEPVDVAKVALFLASDDAVFVSGTGVVVDGGRTS